MNEIQNLIASWRDKAEGLRATAEDMANPFAQASFRRMAETYEKLAEDFRARSGGKDDDISTTG